MAKIFQVLWIIGVIACNSGEFAGKVKRDVTHKQGDASSGGGGSGKEGPDGGSSNSADGSHGAGDKDGVGGDKSGGLETSKGELPGQGKDATAAGTDRKSDGSGDDHANGNGSSSEASNGEGSDGKVSASGKGGSGWKGLETDSSSLAKEAGSSCHGEPAKWVGDRILTSSKDQDQGTCADRKNWPHPEMLGPPGCGSWNCQATNNRTCGRSGHDLCFHCQCSECFGEAKICK